MKKLLFGAVALLLMANCSGNGAKEKVNEDSLRAADSIAQVETAKVAAEQARQDSIRQDSVRQDSIAKSKTLQANSAEVEKRIKEFYEGAVLSGSRTGKKIPWTKSALSKYCTASFIKKLQKVGSEDDIDMYGYSTGDSYAVWILRNPDIQDSDPKDKVISVDVGEDNTVMVTYLDCGVRSKTRLTMKDDKGVWKINNCKFVH